MDVSVHNLACQGQGRRKKHQGEGINHVSGGEIKPNAAQTKKKAKEILDKCF